MVSRLYDLAKQVYRAEDVETLWGMWEVFVEANIQEMDGDKLTAEADS